MMQYTVLDPLGHTALFRVRGIVCGHIKTPDIGHQQVLLFTAYLKNIYSPLRDSVLFLDISQPIINVFSGIANGMKKAYTY